MRTRALAERQVTVDRGPHQRMGEAERIARPQHVRAHELVGRGQRRVGGQTREFRRQVHRSVVLEDRDAARQRSRFGRQCGQPPQHRACERAGRHLRRGRQRRGIGRLLLLRDRRQQLTQLERVARRQLKAAPAELVIGLRQAAPHQLGRRRRPERRQRADPRGGLAGQLTQDLAFAELSVSGPDDDGDRLVGQASRQIHQEAQRGLVRPVGVVDHEQQRPRLRQPRDKPVQGMENREARLEELRVVLTCVEQHPRRRGRARPTARRACAERPAKQRPRDAPSERALQLVPARRQHRDRALARHAPRALQQRRLAHARRPLDKREPTSSLPRVLEQLPQHRELGVALQQRLGRRRPATRLQLGRHPASIPRSRRAVQRSSYREGARTRRPVMRPKSALSIRIPTDPAAQALRLIILKADGSVLVHADAGGYKPLNC